MQGPSLPVPFVLPAFGGAVLKFEEPDEVGGEGGDKAAEVTLNCKKYGKHHNFVFGRVVDSAYGIGK